MIVYLIWMTNHFVSGHKIQPIMLTGSEYPEEHLRRVPDLLKIILPEAVRIDLKISICENDEKIIIN